MNDQSMKRVPLTRTLGEVVKSYRQSLGISQEELAQRSGLHRTYISNIEQGVRNPSLSTLSNVAAALNLECSVLVQLVEHRARELASATKALETVLQTA